MEYGNAKLAAVRKRFPQYDRVPDDRLADAIHRKFYPTQPRERVFQALGLPDLQSATPAQVLPPPPPVPTEPAPLAQTLMHDARPGGLEELARAPSERQAQPLAPDQQRDFMRERVGNLFDRLGQTSFAQSDLAQTLGRGIQRARQSGVVAAADAGLIEPGTAQRQYGAAQSVLERLRPASPDVQRGLEEITGARGPLSAAGAAIRNPEAVLSTAIESLPYSAPSAALALGGAALGPLGVAAGAGAGSFIAEYGASLTEVMRENGIDPAQPGALERALNDAAFIGEARRTAMTRAGISGGVDAATGGVAGGLLRGARGPVSAGVRGTGELGIQAVGGSTGEAGAQLATDGRVNWGDVILEGVAEVPGGAPEIVGGMLARGPQQPAMPEIPGSDPRVDIARAQAAAVTELDPNRQRPSVLDMVVPQQVQTVAPPQAQSGPAPTIVQPAPATFQQAQPQAVATNAQAGGNYAAPMQGAAPPAQAQPTTTNPAQNIPQNIPEAAPPPPAPVVPPQAVAQMEAVQQAVRDGATAQQAIDMVQLRAMEQAKEEAGIGGFQEADVVQFLDETGTRTGRVSGFTQTPDGLQIRIATPDGETVLYEGPAAGEQFTQLDTAAMPPEQKRGVYLSAYPDGEVTQRRVQKFFAITPKAAGELMRTWGAIEKAEAAAVEAAKPTPQKVEEAAAVTAEPTPAQAEAGNYRKGRVEVQGLEIAIETPKGAERTGLDRDGKPWSAVSPAHYGYFERGEGADGDKLDVFVGDAPDAPVAFVIDQYDPEGGKFDEAKVILGTREAVDAVALYEASFSDGSGPNRWGAVTPLTVQELKAWIAGGDTTKPLGPPPVRETTSPEPEISTASTEPVAEAPVQPDPIPEPARQPPSGSEDQTPAEEKDDGEGRQGREGEQQGQRDEVPEPVEAPADEPVTQGATPEGDGEPKPRVLARRIRQRIVLEVQKPAPRRLVFGDLQNLAAEVYGGSMASGAFSAADVYDAAESAVNSLIARSVLVQDAIDGAGPVEEALADIRKAQRILPTQTRRADEKITFQQFSTPPEYAFAVAWAGAPRGGEVVLEPSAGTGSLVAMALGRTKTVVYANEIDPRRIALLMDPRLGIAEVFTEDAEQLDRIIPDEVEPTLVLMNPPFSAAGNRGIKRDTMTGARHIEQALERLQPSGRLVAIVGRGMSLDAATFRSWWAKMRRRYNVRANIAVSGDLYRPYGTDFATRVLVFDKDGPTSGAIVQGEASTPEDIIRLLEGVRDDRPSIVQRPTQPSREERPKAAQSPRERPQVSAVAGDAGRGAGAPTDARPGARAGEGGERDRPSDRPVQERASGRQEVAGVADEGQRRPTEPEPVRPSAPEPRASADEGGAPVQREADGDAGRVPEPEPAAEQSADDGRVDESPTAQVSRPMDDKVFQGYDPQVKPLAGAAKHPTPLVESAAMATVRFPETKAKPNLPAAVVKDGRLSAAQIETIALAEEAHSKMLPDGERRRGFFIGDGTGVGKGAQIAGIITSHMRNGGAKKAVWISKSQKLFEDATRDWKWVGGQESDLRNLSKAKLGEKVKHDGPILFATFDTLRGNAEFSPAAKITQTKKKGVVARVQQIIDWIGDPDFDGVIAFDEAHRMGNAVTLRVDGRPARPPSQTALAGVYLQRAFPKARIIYASATGATEVSNLSYAERLGLWGPGTSFPDVGDFIAKIESGGMAAMELVARDLKQQGLYTARALSMDGVKYERVEHELTSDQRDLYSELAKAWQLVLKNVNKALDITGGRKNRLAKQAAYAAFWSSQQRFFNQVMISMQMPTALRAIEKDLAAGNAVVIQLTNTNEAQQERALAKADAGDEDDFLDLDLTPRDMLMEMIEKGFPTEQYEEVQDPDTGTKYWQMVKDSEGNPVHNREALAAKQVLLEKLASIRVPLGAMEQIIKEFGTGKVAEVTGRSRRVVWEGEKQKVESRPASANSAEIKAFQDDKKQVLIFSMAGGTGASYHADIKAKNQRLRRHYLLQAGWRADEAIQGFGRTHRTNQKMPPEYVLVTTDLKGQKRFMSTIARRLAQLGAITRGQRQAGEGVFSERDNLESKYAELAVTSLFRDASMDRLEGLTVDDMIEELGLAVRNELTGKVTFSAEPSVPKFLNRILSVTVERQNVLFDMFQTRMDQAIQAAAERGELDTGLQTIKATSAKVVREETIYLDRDTNAETKYTHVEADVPRKRMRFADIERRVEGFVVNKRSGQIWGYAPSRSSTDREGRVSQVRTLVGPSTEQRVPAEEINDTEKFGKVRGAEAKGLWQQALDSTPATRKVDYHLITGAILPIFNRLPGRAEVFRVQLDDGRRLIGMNLSDDARDSTLEKFNVGTDAPNLSPAEAVREVMENVATLKLANGWTVRRVRVAGEQRAELIGPDWRYERELGDAGVFWETKDYRKRYFLPTGAKAADAMAAAVRGREIVKVQRSKTDREEEAAAFSLLPGSGFYSAKLTPAAAEQRGEIIRRAVNIAKEVNPRVHVETVERLFGSGPAILASGGQSEDTVEIGGIAVPDIDLIVLSLNMDDDGVIATAAHEAWHTIEDLLDPKELAILRRAYPASGTTTQAETLAYAFGDWLADQETARGTPETRRIFARIKRFLQRLGNMLRGLGFESADDIFERAARGEIAARDVLEEAFGPSFEGDTLQIGPSSRAMLIPAPSNEAGKINTPSVALLPTTRASSSTALEKARKAGAPLALKPTLRDRIYRLADIDFDRAMTRVTQATFDRYHAIEKLERKVAGTGTRFQAGDPMAAFAAAHFASNPQSFMEVALHHAGLTYDAQAGVVRPKHGSQGLLEVLAPLDTIEKMEAFERYAWARRARELKKQGREPADQKVIDANYAVAKDFPEVVDVFNGWTKFNQDTLTFAQQAGLLSPEIANQLKSDAHYVPFFRAEVDQNGKLVEAARQGNKRSIADQRSGIVKLKGSDRPVEIIENMVRNTRRLIDASYKNIAMQRATRLMTRGNSVTGETVISKAPREWMGVQTPVAMLEKMLAQAGITSIDFSGLTPTDKASMGRIFGMVPPTFKHQDGKLVVSVMVNGKPQYYQVHDELLFQALHALTPAEMEGLTKLLFNLAKLPARLLRWGVTHDPAFALANFGRDTLSTWIVSGANPLHIARAVGQAGREAALASVYGDETRDPRVVEALAAGAGIGGWWDYSPDAVRKTMMRNRRIGDKARDWRGRADLALALPRASWDRYTGILRASEQANRIALLEQLKREGEGDAEAAFQAMNLLNFGARGSSRLVQILVELTPFLNARLQGLRRLGQAAVGKEPVRRNTRLGFWVNSTLLLGATAALYALTFDDPEYDDLEEWEKDGYYHVRMSRWIEEQTGVRWFRFPKPFELGLVLSTIPMRIFDQVLKEEARGKEMKEALARGLFGTLAVEPTAAGTLALEQRANYDLYFGRSIVTNPELPAGWQYEPWTQDTYRAIGQQFGVSPQRLEHLWESTMGTMGTYGTMLTDTYIGGRPKEAVRWFERPVFKRFFRGDSRRSKWQERYYEAKSDFDAAMTAVRKAKREGITVEDVEGLGGRKRFFNITGKQLGIVKKQIEATRSDRSLSPEQRRQKLDELYGLRDGVYREVRNIESLPELEVRRRPAP